MPLPRRGQGPHQDRPVRLAAGLAGGRGDLDESARPSREQPCIPGPKDPPDTAPCNTGKSHSFGGEYVELTPHERIRYTDRFDDPDLPGEMQTTITLKKVSCGTELNVVQEGLPDVIPPEPCCLGWQESLTLLARLVEADIPDRRWQRAAAAPDRGCTTASPGFK